MVELREASRGDGDRLWEIRRRAVEAVEPGHYDDEQIAAWSRRGDLPDFPYDDPTQYLVVAETEEGVVGFGGAGVDGGEIKALYASPDVDARVGTPLVEDMESVLVEAGNARLTLDASLNSVPFYRRFGYSREETVVHENHGVELEFVRMAKHVAE